jgi:hypothetical protein
MHAIIKVDVREIGDELCKLLNDRFAQDRRHFPPEQGWRAEIIHSETTDEQGNRKQGQRLHPNHAWLRS